MLNLAPDIFAPIPSTHGEFLADWRVSLHTWIECFDVVLVVQWPTFYILDGVRRVAQVVILYRSRTNSSRNHRTSIDRTAWNPNLSGLHRVGQRVCEG